MSATREDWRTLAEQALGAPVQTLRRVGVDGLDVAPLSERRHVDPRLSSRLGAWRVAQRVDHPDAEAANRQALIDLEGGADALTIVTRGSPFARGFGISPDRLAAALENVELDLISARLDAGTDAVSATDSICALIEDRRWTSAGLDVDLGYDPIGTAARRGQPCDPSALSRILERHVRAGLSGHPLLADGRPFHEAGGTPSQELAGQLAAGISYLRLLEGEGLALDAAREMLAFLVAVEPDLAVSIAKLRALRRLWARIETAAGLTPRPVRLHAETSWRAMSDVDPWVNMMRITAGAAAAGLGGADVMTALPFTAVSGLPDEWARRLARNAQRILIDEAHLDAVEDPAEGAGSFEDLTDALCTQAWIGFQEIERDGGLETSLAAGHFPRRLAETARLRAAALAHQTIGLVGTSRFPSLERSRIGVLDVSPLEQPERGPLPALRDAVPFETRRARVDALPVRPRVQLVALGAPAAFGPRAIFAANVFAVAGLAAPIPAAPADPERIDVASDGAGTPVACLVGTDEAYAQAGRTIVAALRAAGATFVAVAGATDVAADIGGDCAINESCDLLSLLDDALAALGIS